MLFGWYRWGCMKHNKSRRTTAECADSLISTLIQSSNEQQAKSRLLQDLINDVPHPLWVLGKDNIEYFNQALSDYLGTNLSEYGLKNGKA